MACSKWSSGWRWSDGTKWCGDVTKEIDHYEALTDRDGHRFSLKITYVPVTTPGQIEAFRLTKVWLELGLRQYRPYNYQAFADNYGFTAGPSWNLQSPDGTVWAPSITTGGVLSFVSGAARLTDCVVRGQALPWWQPTISNIGVVTLTSYTPGGSGIPWGTIVDSAGAVWYWYMDLNNVAILSTTLPTNLASERNPPGERIGLVFRGSGNEYVIQNLSVEMQLDRHKNED